MSTRRHPVDEAGRVLPHPGWPADRQAPPPLELVRRFANSINRENGAERFSSARSLDAWLADEGRSRCEATAEQLAVARAVRDGLHEIARANADRRDPGAGWRRLQAATEPLRLRFTVADEGLAIVAASDDPFDALIADVLVIALEADRLGTLRRLKACRHCGWVVYDGSKNGSVRWCSMQACGGRHNAREYRRRHA